MYIRRKTKQKIYSYFATLAIIALLIITGPANAVNVDIPDLPSQITPGQVILFSISVDILTGEQIPLKYSELRFTNPSGTLATCRIQNDGSLSTTPSCPYNIKVTIAKSQNLGYGYGYGYGYNTPPYGYGYAFGYGYGYGLTNGQSGKMTYNVAWDTTGIQTGNYKVQAAVHAGTNSVTWVSSERSVTANTPTTNTGTTPSTGAGGGGRTITPNRGIPPAPSTPATIQSTPVTQPTPATGTPTTPTEPTPATATAPTPGLLGGIGAAITNVAGKIGTPAGIALSTVAIVTIVMIVIYARIIRRRPL